MAGKYTDVNLFERIGNIITGATTQQKYIDEQRDRYNQYADYWRKQELGELKTQRSVAILAAKRQYAGDKQALTDELNRIESEYDNKEAVVKRKYKRWDKHAMYDADAASGQDRYDNGSYISVSNLERAKMFEQHYNNTINAEGEEGDRMRKAFAQNDSTTKQNAAAQKGNDTERGNISNNAAANISNSLYGRDPSGRSAQLRRQAQMHDIQAANEQKSSQQNFQIANRDARVEADKDALATGAIKNAQAVNNLASGTSAGTAALNRTVEQGDVNAHRQRQDAQHTEGVKNQREMWGARQTAEEERGAANITDYQYRQSVGQTAMSDYLSQPGDDDTTSTAGKPGKVAQEDTTNAGADADTATDANVINGQQCVNAALGYTMSTDNVPVTAEEYEAVEKLRAEQFPMLSLVPQRTFQTRGLEAKAAEAEYIRSPQFGGTAADREAFMNALRALRSPDDIHKNFNESTARAESATHTVEDTADVDAQDAINSALSDTLRR